MSYDPLKNIGSVTIVNRETGETTTTSARDFLEAMFGFPLTDDQIRAMQAQTKWSDEEVCLNETKQTHPHDPNT